jgi:putative nucleotidyltransferase with HDIG domain
MTPALAHTREQSWELVCEWTSSESLRRHMLAVEVAMRAYAQRFGEDEELWGATGLLHDLDYERHPSATDGHPRFALRELEACGYPPELIRAVASHADYLGVARETRMEQTLYAVDELTGFILAVAYVRPDGLTGIDREALQRGADELGVPFDEHLAFVIDALEQRSRQLVPRD